MKPFALMLTLLCLCMSGCLVPSLHPFYTEETLVTEPNLIGTWSADEMAWEFKPDQETSLILTIYEEDKTADFKVYLFTLEDELFMDLYPEEMPKNLPLPDFYKMHLLPVHHLMHVNLESKKLTLHYLDLEKWAEMLETSPQLLCHEVIHENFIVLTDSSEAIQTFLKTFNDYPALWHEDPIELTPVPAVDPNQTD